MHPRLSRGWAKTGERLRILTTSNHHQRLNVSGWVAPLLGRYGMVKTEKGDRRGFLNVLRHLYRRLKGYVIWLYVDGARWHKGDEVEEFIRQHKRLHVDYLPPYQPALNMQERIWRRIRYEGTTNHWFENLDATWSSVQRVTHSWSGQKIRRLCNII
jgi:hypothetical protein